MKLVDVHVHLSDAEYDRQTDDLIVDAKNSGVVALVSNSMDLHTSIESLKLAERHPGLVYVALGIHPWNVSVLQENKLEETLKLISENAANSRLLQSGKLV